MTRTKIVADMLKRTPPDAKVRMRRMLIGSHLGRNVLSWYHRSYENQPLDELADAFLVSYPKCGRTWLKTMLGKALALHFDIQARAPLSLLSRPPEVAGLPKIQDVHEDQPEWKTPAQLSTDKSHFKGRKVIFLVRDIRDLAVSNYFEKTRRVVGYSGDMSSFLREEVGSVDTMIAYYKIWHDNRHVPGDFLLVRYEDMHEDPARELRRVLDFIGLPDADQAHIARAVDAASFENMHSRERSKGEENPGRGNMKPGDVNDPESYKTRKGKAGGFVEYLSDQDIAYLNEKLSTLPELYGYRSRLLESIDD